MGAERDVDRSPLTATALYTINNTKFQKKCFNLTAAKYGYYEQMVASLEFIFEILKFFFVHMVVLWNKEQQIKWYQESAPKTSIGPLDHQWFDRTTQKVRELQYKLILCASQQGT